MTQRTMAVLHGRRGTNRVEKSGEQFAQDGAITAVEVWRVAGMVYRQPERRSARCQSEQPQILMTQSLSFEPLLKNRAEVLGAQLRFATELVSFEEDSSGVTAQIRERDSGKISSVRARSSPPTAATARFASAWVANARPRSIFEYFSSLLRGRASA